MKRIVSLSILLIFSITFAQAGGVGISPAIYKEFFESNLTRIFQFHSFSSDPANIVTTYVRGDLAEYVTLSEEYMIGGGDFSATISLPEKISKPGIHTILVGVIEGEYSGDANVGGVAAIQGRIDIIVPYPGKYAESHFSISNINEGEQAKYELGLENLGSQDIQVNPTIEVFKTNTTEPLLTETFLESTVKPKETITIRGELSTEKFSPGEYIAIATMNWGEEESMNKTFKVGEFLVDIVDYDYQFEQGKINPFQIQVQNKWNTPISPVYASVSITDEGILVGDFKTVSVETAPWEIKNITGYFDTSELEAKRYTARIEISYGEESTSKLVAIYINPSAAKTYRNYIIAGAILALAIIAAFIYLILKIRNLEHKNGKKK